MISLNTIKVASPCPADWDKMEGDEQVRFCGGCRKNVYNLSAMNHDEAQALVNRMEGRLCVRFYTRADGTLLTQDCPVGLHAVRRKLIKKLSYAAAVLLSCASGLTRWTGTAQAVTAAKKHATAAKPMTATPSHSPTSTTRTHPPVQHLMGKLIAPGKMTGGLGQFPQAHPFGSAGNAYLGGMQAPPPTMGAPLASPKK